MSVLIVLVVFLLIDLIFFDHPRTKVVEITVVALIFLRWVIIFLFPKFMGEYFLSEVNLIKRMRKSLRKN